MGRDKVEQRTSDFSQNLLDKLPVAVCSLDSAGCFTYLNTAACQLLGYPDESALLGALCACQRRGSRAVFAKRCRYLYDEASALRVAYSSTQLGKGGWK
ncbi:PAS domain-containing protein [Halorhodospira halochloris]|uniref:PAS domain-containing protein n=1 Tax=Halorhodospira halochloris TaxID=1052 RepID=UPI001EE90D53|nr:PAS domain-containing protein [Halorhodospira halochloris]MCG5549393.1 PAS domain-containing protein [Halorhodospira halochloris]